jgi:hypothetical protein
MALQIGAFSYSQEDYNVYPLWFTSSTKYLWKSTYKREIVKTELISDKELQNFKTSTRINT